jgi:multidrug efflux system membrane fusion protein
VTLAGPFRRATNSLSRRYSMNLNASSVAAEPTPQIENVHEGNPPKIKKRRWWLWLIAFVVLAGAGFWLLAKWQAQSAATKPPRDAVSASVPVAVARAQKGEIPVYLNGLGSVTPFNTVTVRSRIDGQLLRVTFQEGQFVRQGDILAEIDPRPFKVQLDQAEGQLARDQAQLNNAKLDLQRYTALVEHGVITRQQYDTQGATVRQFDGVIRADQAAIDNAKLNISYCRITAPLAGRVGLRLADVGNMIHATDQNGLVVITQVQPIAVLFTIPEDSLGQVLKRIRSGEQLSVEASDRSGQTKIADGKVATIDNQIDQTTGTSRLKAVFDNKDNTMFPNQFVNVRLLVEMKKDRILIPAVAIQRGPQGTFVYVVKPDQTVDVRQVTVGIIEGTQASIDNGLSDGEQVVVDGVDKLRAGIKVQTATGEQ